MSTPNPSESFSGARRRILAVTLAAAAGVLLGAGRATAASRRGGAVPTVVLAEQEKADLFFMREEEKLARDVYKTLYARWRLPVFANIASSEQSHMDAMLNLLNAYRLPDPAAGKGVGEFTDQELQSLYDELVARGSGSAVDALKVGGFIEEVDIHDIQAAIDAAAQSRIDSTYLNLLNGSRNHLRAFAANIVARTGQPYAAQYLGQAEVDIVLAS